MTLIAYQTANLARGKLLNPINAAGVTLILQSWQGGLFPATYPYFLLIEQYDSTSSLENKPVLKREIVKVTNKSSDTFTIVRSSGLCPANDSAVTQTNTAFAFNAWDSVYLIDAAEMYKDMQDAISWKLESVWWLRTGMWNRKLIYTNGSGQEILLSLWAAGTFLRSNWPSAIPDFWAAPIDINGQTTTDPVTLDFFPFYDTSWAVNWKSVIAIIASFLWIYGDWSDWDVTISGTVTLSRDMYYNNLTIPGWTTLNPNWYRFFVKWTMSGTGFISRSWSAWWHASWSTWWTAWSALGQWSLNAEVAPTSWANWVSISSNWANKTWTDANPSMVSTNWANWWTGWWAWSWFSWWTSTGWVATRGIRYNQVFMPSLVHPATASTTFPGLNYKSIPWSAWGWSGANNAGTTWLSWWGWGWGWNGWMVWCAVYNWNFTGTVYLVWWAWGNGWDSQTTWWGWAWGWWGWWGWNWGVLFRIYSVMTNDCTKTLTWWAWWAPWNWNWWSSATAWSTGTAGTTISVVI